MGAPNILVHRNIAAEPRKHGNDTSRTDLVNISLFRQCKSCPESRATTIRVDAAQRLKINCSRSIYSNVVKTLPKVSHGRLFWANFQLI
jgi:hypothetical protein